MYEKLIIKRIKQIRKNKQITLQALAKKTGLTAGYLSRVENSDSAPPIATLHRLAEGLDIPIEYLVSDEDQSLSEKQNIVIERNLIKNVDTHKNENYMNTDYGYYYQPIAKKRRYKNMQPYIIVPDFELGPLLKGNGELLLHVIDGNVELFYGSDKYVLSEGECAYFDTHIPHNAKSIGEKKAKILVVIYRYKGPES